MVVTWAEPLLSLILQFSVLTRLQLVCSCLHLRAPAELYLPPELARPLPLARPLLPLLELVPSLLLPLA